MSNRAVALYESNAITYRQSNTITIDYQSIRIGASQLEIKESAGDFDFSAINISNVGLVDGRDVSADGATLDGHLNGGASKHDATEIDFEKSDGSKKNINAASDDVESAISDLDEAIGTLAQGSNYTAVTPTIVASHLAAIDSALAAAAGTDILDTLFRISDNGDNTKKIAFQASGIGSGVTRTITMPDTDINLGDIALKVAKAGSTMDSAANLTFQGGGEVLGLPSVPTTTGSAASKAYVDAIAVGARMMPNAKAASTANIDLVTGGLLVIDGYQTIAGDYIVVKDQTDAKQNGYYIAAAGAWSRAAELDNSPSGEIYNGKLVPRVFNGTANINKSYVIVSTGSGVNGLHTIGVDNITWDLFTPPTSLTFGDGVDLVGTTVNVVVSDIVGSGLENDGSNNIRIAASAAGDGLAGGGGSALSVSVSDLVGEGIKNDGANNFARDDAKSFTNDNAGAITVRKVAYIKTNGNVDLARADVSGLAARPLAIVQDASIASAAAGLLVVREGAIISGFSGLTPGTKYYVDGATAGSITATEPTTSGMAVYEVGEALTSTTLKWMPRFKIVVG